MEVAVIGNSSRKRFFPTEQEDDGLPNSKRHRALFDTTTAMCNAANAALAIRNDYAGGSRRNWWEGIDNFLDAIITVFAGDDTLICHRRDWKELKRRADEEARRLGSANIDDGWRALVERIPEGDRLKNLFEAVQHWASLVANWV